VFLKLLVSKHSRFEVGSLHKLPPLSSRKKLLAIDMLMLSSRLAVSLRVSGVSMLMVEFCREMQS
jgi:hypothetical protein